MVLIIVLGESLISAGTGAGNSVTAATVLFAALLGFVAVVCLWSLYFADVAGAAQNALERASGAHRAQIARDAYTMVHFLLIAGVIYVALGIREVLSDMSGGGASNGGVHLSWPATTALYGGAAVYLLGRAAFSRLTVGSVPAAQLVVAGALLVLIPVARQLPALAALGTVSAALLALVAFEWRAKCLEAAGALSPGRWGADAPQQRFDHHIRGLRGAELGQFVGGIAHQRRQQRSHPAGRQVGPEQALVGGAS
jgi:low temperature requirement protein LtrA